ncbi:MAG: PSD1 and planctomycete cytochrome C domain-containing protein [Planctomycetaceae bacterium]
MFRHFAFVCLLQVMVATSIHAQDPSSTDFFESRIRPILVEHCTGCHGESQQEAGLRLDSGDSFRKGGDSGRIFDSNLPHDSMILRAVRYEDDIRMPPDGRLPDEQIRAIEQWVKDGAVWPAEAAPQPNNAKSSVFEQAKDHWAFQPIRTEIAPPDVEPSQVSRRDAAVIDQLIDAGLQEVGLSRNQVADRRTLIRRATFDLHGLPPTPQEVREFENDSASDAWPRLIDRLLASPRYGERWARHWLDVARYSDTKGYVRLKDNPLYPAAWTYRDYVIQAFNEDLPYDQFVLEQLAADQLSASQLSAERPGTRNLIADRDPQSLAAMGFLTLGQRFINSPNDIIDDRIDVVTRGLLGLTVTCARCHDHKFDPVPTADYYSLHGVFASSYEPDDPPLILPTTKLAQHQAYLEELERRTKQFDDFLHAKKTELESSFRRRAGEYLLAGQFEKVQANFLPVMFLIDASKDLNPAVIQRWARLLEKSRRRHDPVLRPWHKLAQLAETESANAFTRASAELIAKWYSDSDGQRINRAILDALKSAPLNNLKDVSERYSEVFANVDILWNTAKSTGSTALSDTDLEEVRQLLYGADSPAVVSLNEIQDFLFVDATTQNQFHEQQRQIEDWIASPGAAPHAHILLDSETPSDSPVFLRGNASNPGEKVPRQFLQVLSSPDRRPFQTGSGRLELALAIVSPENPLTARVLVNRVWLHHFGNGLVRTPSDFGLRGEAPTHPELLDYLASQFMTNGWSIKTLHRTIMLSEIYQQQSLSHSEGESKDPENRWLWRMNRRRLDWESLRDSLLKVSGQIDFTMGGPSVPLLSEPFSTRRSIYGFIDRQNLPGLFRTFDFVAPDSSAPQRLQTTVPQQALYLLNSPFMQQRTAALANRISSLQNAGDSADVEQRICNLYELIYSRSPTADELQLGKNFLADIPPADPSAAPALDGEFSLWQEYVQSLLLSNEFVFVD